MTKEQIYKQKRLEYNRESFRKVLDDCIPKVCCNCGRTEGIQYHHIVPLKFGGTNKITNIVPLCGSCHTATHFGRHISKCKNNTNNGRSPISELNQETEEIMWSWAKGEISTKECEGILGITARYSRLSDRVIYRQFIKKNGIMKIRNIRGVIEKNAKDKENKVVSTIFYNNGEKRYYYHG